MSFHIGVPLDVWNILRYLSAVAMGASVSRAGLCKSSLKGYFGERVREENGMSSLSLWILGFSI